MFFDEYNYFSDVYDQADYGFDIFMRKPITNFLSVKLDYTIQEIEFITSIAASLRRSSRTSSMRGGESNLRVG